MLPLIHLHSLAVLFVVTAFLFVFRWINGRWWIAFGIGTSIVAVSELIWSNSGQRVANERVFGWNFGWDKKPEESYLWFWIKNTGVFIPLLTAGIYLVFSKLAAPKSIDAEIKEAKRKNRKKENAKENQSFLPITNRCCFSIFRSFFYFSSATLPSSRLGMGQHQGFDLLVRRLDSVRRAGFDSILQTRQFRARNRSGVFDFADRFRRDGRLAHGVETDKL
jgi:hypothetical protein